MHMQHDSCFDILCLDVDQPSTAPQILLEPNNFDENTLGQRQDVICSISVPPDVDPDTIELGWLNEDDIVTNDSRVTVINSTSNSSNYISTVVIHFDPLFEEDEGTYFCYSIVNGTERFTSIQLQNFKSMYVIRYVMSAHLCTHIRM